MNTEALLGGIELPEGVTHDRVMSVRYSGGRSVPTVITIEVIETVPPAFQGHRPCSWNYLPRRGEQVARSISGYAAVIAAPYTITRTFVHADGAWCESIRGSDGTRLLAKRDAHGTSTVAEPAAG